MYNMILAAIPAVMTDTASAATDSIAAASIVEQATPVVQELSVWDLCLKGGFIMVPLVLLSLVCIYVFIELNLM